MTCMTTKKKFVVPDPEVVVLANGRYAYRAQCPWEGKNGRVLTAFKFCSKAAYEEYEARSLGQKPEHLEEESEHAEESERGSCSDGEA